MYEYKFERIYAELGFAKRNFSKHRELIEKYGQNGYRFAGYVPTEIVSNGTIVELDLVFEKENTDNTPL